MHPISDIAKVYPNWYHPEHPLSYDDQKFVWENTPLPEEEENKLKQLIDTNKTNANVLIDSVNGSCKQPINKESTLSKGEVILLLRTCDYKTPPKLLAHYLEIIFSKWNSKEGHWLWIAQRYNPRAINRQINETIKQATRGGIKTTPAQYFTYRIKHRKRRRDPK